MRLAGLSLEQAPPISIPMRFFLAGPVFGMIAALLLLFSGPSALSSRWLPGLLTNAHIMLLGFATMVMFGAIQQFLPVVAGATIPRPRLFSLIVQILWFVGLSTMIPGFLYHHPLLFGIALLSFGSGLLVFIVVIGLSLKRAQARNETVTAIMLAMTSLGIVGVFGMLLAAGYAGWLPLYRGYLTDLHLTWGLLGWMGFLIMGVAYQVVPMFQLTPNYNQKTRSFLVPSLFGLLVLRTLNTLPFLKVSWLSLLLEWSMVIGFALFAIETLWLQMRRKRKIWDATLWFWRVGTSVLLVTCILWCLGQLFGWSKSYHNFHLLLGFLYIFGFVFCVLLGMLLKIVPFLVWFHLQGLQTQRMMKGLSMQKIPHMKDVFSNRQSATLLFSYTGGFALLVTAMTWYAPLLQMAAVTLLFTFGWLLFIVISAYQIYRKGAAEAHSEDPTRKDKELLFS